MSRLYNGLREGARIRIEGLIAEAIAERAAVASPKRGAIIPYEDEADAIAIANDTRYGLSALVLGKNRESCERVARQIDSGRVLVNTLAHEPRAPFGGFKHSVFGREMGRWGMSAYLEPKTLHADEN